MAPALAPHSLDLRTANVGVVDDQRDALARACEQLEDVSLHVTPILLHKRQTLDEVIDEILQRGCEAVVSDHRLKNRALVDFDGAELVYRVNERYVPAVLYSAHVEDDESTTIREWRYRIPRVIKKGPRSVRDIPEALQIATAELAGHRELGRRGFLTPVRVVDIHAGAGFPGVDVTITAWKPDVRVAIPRACLPLSHRVISRDLIGTVFIGYVNFYANEESELFFHDLKYVPETPKEDWGRE